MSIALSIKLPKIVSEYLVDDLEESLNTIFPKMFFNIRVKRRRLKLKVPEKIDINSIVRINGRSRTHYSKSNYEFRIVLPRIEEEYTIYLVGRRRILVGSRISKGDKFRKVDK